MELRKHQVEIIQKARGSFKSGKRRIILTAPCGFGKTIVSAEITQNATEKGSKILFLCHRRELCFQARERFNDYGLDVGLILSGEEADHSQDIQIATIQTYIRRIMLDDGYGNTPWFHDADLIIVDEAHTAISPTYQKLLKEYYPDKVSIGLTATPCRADGRGLGEYFDDIVEAITFGGLVEKKFLVPYRYFSPAKIDLDKIKTVAGDYDKKELGHRVDQPKLIGDIYEQWAKIAGGRQTIIFAVNVKHSIHIKEKFERYGVAIEHIDARTPKDERARVLKALDDGDVQVVTNVGILTEGFDCPVVSCIVLARPTKSYGLYVQMAGRGSRIYRNKIDTILLDHGGCVEEHGILEQDVDWTLDGREKAWSKKRPEKDDEPKVVKCKACHLVFLAKNNSECPDCGSPVKSFGKEILTAEGELRELNAKRKATMAEKRIYFGMLLWLVAEKGWKNGAAAHKYRARFGVWPRGMDNVIPIEPDQAFNSYQKHLMIRYAKSKIKLNKTE